MNHLTLYGYEEDGELFVWRCPAEHCGGTGEAESYCRFHAAPIGDIDWPGLKREPVRVPGVGEELVSLSGEERAELRLLASFLRNNVRIEASNAARFLDRLAERPSFTQQPAGVGADNSSGAASAAPPTDSAAQPTTVSADSDGNQQPQGGVIWCVRCGFVAGREGEVDPFGSWRESGCIGGDEHGPTQTIDAKHIRSLSSGGQEGGVEEGADRWQPVAVTDLAVGDEISIYYFGPVDGWDTVNREIVGEPRPGTFLLKGGEQSDYEWTPDPDEERIKRLTQPISDHKSGEGR